jgi:hypothetical protein
MQLMNNVRAVIVGWLFVAPMAWAASTRYCEASKPSTSDWMRYEVSKCDAGLHAFKDGRLDLALSRWEHLSPTPDVPSRFFAVRKCLVGTGLVKDEVDLAHRLHAMSEEGAVRAPLMHATALLTRALNFKSNRKPYQEDLSAAHKLFQEDWVRGHADSGAVLALMQLDGVLPEGGDKSKMALLLAAATDGSASAVGSIAKIHRDGTYGADADCSLGDLLNGIAQSMWHAEGE